MKQETSNYTSTLHWLAEHPVFRVEEFLAFHSGEGQRSRSTSHALLKHHLAMGHLIHIRRGLYACVPTGRDPASMAPDPYLVAADIAPDAVLAWHAALQYYGRAYSVWTRFPVLTRHTMPPFVFREAEYFAISPSAAQREREDLGGFINEESHAGGRVRVASLERTLVDVLDRPDLAGGWEEVWRSLESIEYFALDEVVSYAQRVSGSLTVARVGFFLEQHQEGLMVPDEVLSSLQEMAPRQVRYFDRQRLSGRLVKPWNLIVPDTLLNRRWEEGI